MIGNSFLETSSDVSHPEVISFSHVSQFALIRLFRENNQFWWGSHFLINGSRALLKEQGHITGSAPLSPSSQGAKEQSVSGLDLHHVAQSTVAFQLPTYFKDVPLLGNTIAPAKSISLRHNYSTMQRSAISKGHSKDAYVIHIQ